MSRSALTVGDVLDALKPVDRNAPVFVSSDAHITEYRHTYLPCLVPVVAESEDRFRDAEQGDDDIITAVFFGTVDE
jgi:hypothetical protein